MSKQRKNYHFINFWARREDSEVWFKRNNQKKWHKCSDSNNINWSANVKWAIVVPETEKYWQAFLDGILYCNNEKLINNVLLFQSHDWFLTEKGKNFPNYRIGHKLDISVCVNGEPIDPKSISKETWMNLRNE